MPAKELQVFKQEKIDDDSTNSLISFQLFTPTQESEEFDYETIENGDFSDSFHDQMLQRMQSVQEKSANSYNKRSVKDDSNVYTCFICNHRYNNKNSLHVHMTRKHKNSAIFPCNTCGQAFQEERKLLCHLITSKSCSKTSAVQFPTQDRTCPICSKRFKNADFLRFHMLTHKGKFYCMKCKEIFNSQEKLQNHLIQHPQCASWKTVPSLEYKRRLKVREKNHGYPDKIRERILEYANNGKDWLALATKLGIKYKTAYYWVRYARLQRSKKSTEVFGQ